MGIKVNLPYGTKDYAKCSYFWPGHDVRHPLHSRLDRQGKRRQALVDQNNAKENKRRIDFDDGVGQKVLLKKLVSSAKQRTSAHERNSQDSMRNCVSEITH